MIRSFLSSRVPAVLLLFLLAGPTLAQSARSALDPKFIYEEFDVARNGDALLLPVSLGTKKYLFILDTGASLSAYDQSLLTGRPKKNVELETGDGPVNVSLYDPPAAFIGALDLRTDELVAGVDLKKMRAVSGLEIYGVVGMDFLKKQVIRVDFDAGKLAFLKKPTADAGRAVPIDFDFPHGEPLVWVEIAGLGRKRFVVDTGFLGSLDLQQDDFQSLVTEQKLKVVGRTLSETLGGTKENRLAQGRGATLAGFRHRDPIFGESSFNNLGLRFLSRFTVTLDFPSRAMYLQKGKRFGEPDRWNQTGLHLLRVDGKTLVHAVDKGSPAAASGLRADDVVLKVAGKAAQELSMFDLYRLLRAAEERIPIAVQRGREEIEIILSIEKPDREPGPHEFP